MSIIRGGGEPSFLSPQSGITDVVARHDGFIIPGGRDLEPALYGERLFCRVEPEEEERVDFEFSLLHEIIRLRKPVLGICYGMQLINVYFQGSLYQDIRTQVPESMDHSAGGHGITVEETSFTSAGTFHVNSTHHQAVKRMGKGLKPFAYADDGIVEAVHGEGYAFLVGVQWHPERMDTDLTYQLFSKFIEACRAER